MMASTGTHGVSVLLIQARELAAVADHERYCLQDLAGLKPEQLDTVNYPEETYLDWGRVEAADVVIIGGSGMYSAVQHYDWTDRLLDDVRRLVDSGKPTLGMAFGHHIIARALGGIVGSTPQSREIGACEIELTPQGHDDPLFNAMPKHFPALLAHNDYVSQLPDNCVELAKNNTCPNQAFKVVDKPVYGTLFHVELTPRTLLDRLERYRAAYCPDQDEFEEMVGSLRPTPDAEGLLKRFLLMCSAKAAV